MSTTKQEETAEASRVPVRCKGCGEMVYVPAYCFTNGFWCGDIRKTLNFECPRCGWREKIIL